jgi:fumarate reductase subunit D
MVVIVCPWGVERPALNAIFLTRKAYTVPRETDMNRWDFLFAVGTVVSMFVPVFVVIFSVVLTGKQRSAAQERRIAAYRKSPDSRLLILGE